MLELTNDNFESEVIQQTGLVIVDFYGDYCGPCRMMAPIFEKAAVDHPEIKFGKVDIVRNRDIANRFTVRAVPTLHFFKGGQIVYTFIGYCPEYKLNELIKQYR